MATKTVISKRVEFTDDESGKTMFMIRKATAEAEDAYGSGVVTLSSIDSVLNREETVVLRDFLNEVLGEEADVILTRAEAAEVLECLDLTNCGSTSLVASKLRRLLK